MHRTAFFAPGLFACTAPELDVERAFQTYSWRVASVSMLSDWFSVSLDNVFLPNISGNSLHLVMALLERRGRISVRHGIDLSTVRT